MTTVPTHGRSAPYPVVPLTAPQTTALTVLTNRHHAHSTIETRPPISKVVFCPAFLARLRRDPRKRVRVATGILRVGDRLQKLRVGAHGGGSVRKVPIRDSVGPKVLQGLEPETTVGGKRR